MIIGSIRFASGVPSAVVVSAALIGAVIVLLIYLRETRTLGSTAAYVIPSLRAAAVALAILILGAPVWYRRTTVGTLGRVVLAVDTSESMSMNDTESVDGSGAATSQPSRIERSLAILLGNAETSGWIDQLQDTHEVEVLAFSDGQPASLLTRNERTSGKLASSKLASSERVFGERVFGEMGVASEQDRSQLAGLDADGKATDLGSPIQAANVSRDFGDASVDATGGNASLSQTAIVLFSDGRHNTRSVPTEFAKQVKAKGATVHAVGMGSLDQAADVAIQSVSHPESVASDGKLNGALTVRHRGISGEDVGVRVYAGDEVVWQNQIQIGSGLSDGSQSLRVPFEIDVKSVIDNTGKLTPRGLRRNTVVLDLKASVSMSGASGARSDLVANNEMPFRVAATIRDRRLLILDGSSRWEVRYLRNLFERDPSWTVNTVLFGPGTDSARIKRGDAAGQFPGRAEELAVYDAIVLGEIPSDQFQGIDADLLKEFVTRGGGLIVLDGRYDQVQRLASQKLADVIPVQFLGERVDSIQTLMPTGYGSDQAVLDLVGKPDQLPQQWRQLPAPESMQQVRARPGADVLVEAETNEGNRLPWLVSRLYGSGRVLYFASDQSWRWRYKVADQIHARFWNQIMTTVMQPPYSAADDYAAIGTDKIEYGSGETPIVRARLQDVDGVPVGDSVVDALVIADNQIIATVPLSVDDPARGTYAGKVLDIPDGAYQIRIRASGFDNRSLLASTPIWVGNERSSEWVRTSLDQNSLQAITTAGGGQYRHESSAEEVLRLLEPLSSGRIIESEYLLWQSYYWFWAIMALLSAEWFLRKRSGLV